MRYALIAFLCVGIAAAPLYAGKLDLDIYATERIPPKTTDERYLPPPYRVQPGDPRSLRGESPWVRYMAHAGYTGLGIAGLLGSLATGGVAPAIGFGSIALIHSYQLWRTASAPNPELRSIPPPH